MPGATHLHFHTAFGAQWLSGGALTGILTDESGDVNTHAQFGVDSVSMADEDIILEFSHNNPQPFANPAEIPVYYREGTDGYWRKKTANTFPIIYSGTAGYTGANGRLPYNEWTGSTWQLTQVGQGDLVLCHYYVTNEVSAPVIGIQGQASYSNIADARAGAEIELSTLAGTSRILGKEFTPLGTVIYQTSTGYTNTPAARIRATADGDDYIDFRGNSISGTGGGGGASGNSYGIIATVDGQTAAASNPTDVLVLQQSGLITLTVENNDPTYGDTVTYEVDPRVILLDEDDNVTGYLPEKLLVGDNLTSTITTPNLNIIAEYLINEASSGQSPTQVLDNRSSPVDLSITYSGAAPAYTTDATGRGLSFDNALPGYVTGTITGTKIESDIENSDKATFEFVVTATDTTTPQFIAGITTTGTSTNLGWFFAGGEMYLVTYYVGGASTTKTATISPGSYVCHYVIDTTESTAADRLKLYVDGSSQILSGGDPSLNATLDLSTNLSLGAFPGGTDPLDGSVFYLSIWEGAMSQSEVTQRVSDLQTSTDVAATGFTNKTMTLDVVDVGNVFGPGSSTDNAIALWDGTDGYTLQDSVVTIDGSGNMNLGSGNITTSGTVDGVDVSDHSARHENGGADEISVAGLSGLLADAQTPTTHASTHLPGGVDALTTTSAITLSGSNAEGSAASFARSDHNHALGGSVGGDLSGTLPNPTVTDLTISSEEQGSVLYFNGSNWVQLEPGEDGYVLTTHDAGANPDWTDPAGGNVVIFPIWAEESATLGDGEYEWSFGNGDLSPDGSGIVVPIDCEAFAMGLDHSTSASATVRFKINTSNGGDVTTSSERNTYTTFGSVYEISAGDVINFQTVTGPGASDGNRVVVWLRANVNSTGSGSGNVTGPASSIDEGIVRFDGTTGKIIQSTSNSPTIDDSGNLYLDTDGSSEGSPRVLGTANWSSGEALRWLWDSGSTGLQHSFGKSLTLFSFHTLVLRGSRNSGTAPAYDSDLGFGVLIDGTTVADEVLAVRGASGQTADLQQWRDSSDNILANIDATGNISLQNYHELRFYDDGSNYVGFEAPALTGNQIWVLPDQDGANGQYLQTNGTGDLSWNTPTGSGDVVGPASATNNAITRYDGTTGKAIQNSGVLIDDTGNIQIRDGNEQRFYDVGNSNYVGFEAPALTGDQIWILPDQDGSNGQVLTTNGTGTLTWSSPGGTGDVTGPGSSTDNAITRFDGTTGKAIQNSGITISDGGDIDMNGGDITDVGNVDGVDVSNHSARHDPGGADALTTASAVSVGASNAEGSAASFARSDHTHAVTDLDITSQEQGSILYYSGSNWVELPPGTDGQVLETQGTGANPQWVNSSSSNASGVFTFAIGIVNDLTINVEQNDSVWCTLVIPANDITINTMECQVVQTGTGNVYFAIYNASYSKLGDETTGVSCSTTGLKSANLISGVSLTAGTPYYFALRSDANGSRFAGKDTTATTASPQYSIRKDSAAASSFPASFTTPSNNSNSLWIAGFN